MNSGAIFLRAGCTLPDGLNLRQQQFCETWMSVEDTMSTTLDVKIRTAGWHFMWLEDAYLCYGVDRTEAFAVTKAITHALHQVKSRFNAAELGSIKASKYPGFRIARIALYARQIQQQPFLSLIDESTIRQPAAR
ncbi:MAG: hypothetical protein WA708_06815 [Acidobacteriaceae bacterium]